MKIELCLIDCASIQQYVFSSNKLKLQIGASQIVYDLYDHFLKSAVKELWPEYQESALENWKEQPDKFNILDGKNTLPFEIGFIGGGNALLLFKEGNAKIFARTWSRLLLENAPGLTPVIAIQPFDVEPQSGFTKDILDSIFLKLAEIKQKSIPQTSLDSFGITAECPISGFSAQINRKVQDETAWISAAVASQLAFENRAEEELKSRKRFGDILENDYSFAKKLEDLGQKEGESNHIAVVHIDGNRMGKRFSDCTNLAQRRRLSKLVDETTKKAFAQLIIFLIAKQEELEEDGIKYKERKLPIRPMILNGDDITFICDARLAFFLAEKFMLHFRIKPLDQDSELERPVAEMPFSSCAGISIIRTKFPISRAYMLAEQACREAKTKAKVASEPQDWLDYHIALGGLSGDLFQIRSRQYQVHDNNLLYRPYRIDLKNTKNSFCQIQKIIRYLRDDKDKKWPRSKIYELRKALEIGQTETKHLIAVLNAREISLPSVEQLTDIDKNGWYGNQTPYFDAIELLDYYPKYLLEAVNEL